jgi:hypothetical protein
MVDRRGGGGRLRHPKLIAAGRAQHALHLAGRERQVALPSALLVEVLRQAVRQPPSTKSPSNDHTMFQHYVVEILTQLDKRTDVEANDLAGLEWAYLPVLTYSRRPAKVLRKGLSEQPSLFIEMIRAAFRPSEGSGHVDPTPENPDHARSVGHQAYRLLNEWDRLPGQRDDGSIDAEAMEAWIKEARAQAHAIGRAEIADNYIGKILSASPRGGDGVWPAEPVRDALDLYRNPTMLDGFRIGKSNRRGVTSRMPRDGGRQERDLVAQYRAWSAAVGAGHPYTAKALDLLALSYEHDAQREDEQQRASTGKREAAMSRSPKKRSMQDLSPRTTPTRRSCCSLRRSSYQHRLRLVAGTHGRYSRQHRVCRLLVSPCSRFRHVNDLA